MLQSCDLVIRVKRYRVNLIPQPSVESSPRLHNLQAHGSLGYHSVQPPSLLPQQFLPCTSGPGQYDTDNAKSNVIISKICSLNPPPFQSCGNNWEEGLAVWVTPSKKTRTTAENMFWD